MNGYHIGDRTENGDILTLLNIEDLFPFFQNPVKWCEPDKLIRFKELIEKGVQFPPITVARVDEKLVVYDGHHRWFAAYLIGQKQILAWVTE